MASLCAMVRPGRSQQATHVRALRSSTGEVLSGACGEVHCLRTLREAILASAADILELTDLLSRAERRVSRALARLLEREGATVVRWRVLALVADGGEHAMSEVVERALVPAPTATRLIDQMTSEGLVRRALDPDDRRRVLVSIRPGGHALYLRLARRIEHERETLLASCDERELGRLVSLLTSLGLVSR